MNQLKGNLPVVLIMSIAQQLWDRADAAGYLPQKANTPVLLHSSEGDNQVHLLSATIMARSFGAKLLEPYPETDGYGTRPAFLESMYAPEKTGSAFVIWRFEFTKGVVLPGDDDNLHGELLEQPNTHPCTPFQEEAYKQLTEFAVTGRILQYCDNSTGCISNDCGLR